MATWPTWTVEDQLSGAGAKTLGRDFHDRATCLRSRGIGYAFGEVSSASGSWATVATRSIRLPQWVRSGDTMRLHLRLKVSVGSITGYARFCDASVNGSTASTSATLYGSHYSDVVVPDDTWAGTRRTFRVEAYRSAAGFVYVTTSPIIGALRVIPA